MKTITEESATIAVGDRKLSKKMGVFYNPVMKLNRDMSVLLLNSLGKKNMQIADPLAGSGVRAVRFLKELKKGIIERLYVNDYSADAVAAIYENLKQNECVSDKVFVSQKDANLFLLESTGFDYIDIDPFGSPVPFLDSAVRRISRSGVLAVTATDTSALAGTYPKVCKRRYWAIPLRNELMHEIGLRILIRKVQLIGMQYEKALIPVVSYSKDHYYRIFFKVEKSKEKCDVVVKKHQLFYYCSECMVQFVGSIGEHCGKAMQTAGPLWTGQLGDVKLLKKMEKNADVKMNGFVSLLLSDASAGVGFYDLHVLAKKYKKKAMSTEEGLKKLKGVRTHFSGHAIKTDKEISKIIQSLFGHQ